jgi:hypothetical protein
MQKEINKIKKDGIQVCVQLYVSTACPWSCRMKMEWKDGFHAAAEF